MIKKILKNEPGIIHKRNRQYLKQKGGKDKPLIKLIMQQDTLKEFALQVQQMREAQRAYYVQVAVMKRTKTLDAFAEAENILAESRRLEKLVDESVSMLTMPGNLS